MNKEKNNFQIPQSSKFPNLVLNESTNSAEIYIQRINGLSFLNLRIKSKDDYDFKKIYGCDLPLYNNTFMISGNRKIIWLGPDEFLLIFENHEEKYIFENLNILFSKQHYALTNISDSQEIFCLSGHYVRDLLSKGCPIDLHINSFNKGMSAQTILEKVDVLLFCNDKNSISITFKRSYYDYVSSWIKDAATEFGYKFSD